MLNQAFFVTWLAASVGLAGPVLLAAQGEIFAERAGVLNIGLEGTILLGALGSYLAAVATGSTPLGFVAGGVTGLAVGAVLALFYVGAQASQVVVGIVFNILAAGVASYVYDLAAGTSAPTIGLLRPVHLPVLSALPVLGPVLFRHPLPLYLTLLIVVLAQVVLFRTRFGLALIAVGEHPRAAHAAGISVARMRVIGVLLSGLGGGLAGAYLVTAQIGLYRDNIVSGEGFIALAIVIFGRWSPLRSLLAALVFGGADALQLSLQLFNDRVPAQVLLCLPYILTILAVSGLLGGRAQPAALMLPYRKE
ncbi:MAG TPA: ABC transporter permease [Acetobacteraceae bacterium]|nr:ABC transporter permease [Acetobacteraceae bacterium]